jgi:hypothetical protein
MGFKSLSAEQKDKLKEAKSLEEIEEAIEEEGYELSDDQLDAIAGGEFGCPRDYCPWNNPCPIDGHCPLDSPPVARLIRDHGASRTRWQ